MRQELLNYIHCPACGEATLNLSGSEDDKGNISDGQLNCVKCRSFFKIDRGIVYLFKNMSEIALKDKASHEQEIADDKARLDFQDDDWILNYPDVIQMGIDARSEKTGKLISENTELSIKKFINKSNSVILEIGAGKCWVMSRLAKHNYCVALDILTRKPIGLEAGEVYMANYRIFFERVVADMIELPFKDQMFDYVIISSTLHHSPDLNKTLAEVKRVLKSSGQVILLNEPYQGLIGGQERTLAQADYERGLHEARYSIKFWHDSFSSGGFMAKIFLPENLVSILKFKSWPFKKLAVLLSRPLFLHIITNLFKPVILYGFDGYFNAILKKRETR